MKFHPAKLSRLLYCLFCVCVVPTLQAQDSYHIKAITFAGNKSFTAAELAQNMTLQSKTGLRKLMFWQSGGVFSRSALRRDLERITEFYRREGFIDAKIDTAIVTPNDDARTVALTIEISEGQPLLISDIRFSLQVDVNSDAQRARDIFLGIYRKHKLKKGERFRDEKIIAVQEQFSKIFNNRGYPFIKIVPVLNVRGTDHTVLVNLSIETGPLCVFGEVTVNGNRNINRGTILRQLGFKRGDIFSQDAILRSQQQIYNLGVFQYVSLRLHLDETKLPDLPVEVVVKEAPRLTIKVGTGYGREESFRVFAETRRLGLFGAARRSELFLKHSKLEPVNANLTFVQPYFFSPKMSAALNPFYRIEDEISYRISRLGANFTLQRRYGRYSNGYLNYTLEQDNLKVAPNIRETALDRSNIKLYNKSSITLGLTRDTSRPLFEPAGGIYRALTLTYSGLGFRSDFQYFRSVIEVRRYQSIAPGWVVATRLEVGVITPLGRSTFAPIEERFYAGGSYSVRGWARYQLGPKNRDGDPIGGNSLAEGNVELRFPILSEFRGVFFVDFGNVWAQEFQYIPAGLQFAVGAGLRYKTPIGPIRLDFGVPAGRSARRVQLHISVGNAF